jgi:PIN domain nuclease of toxin-antitoxin system
VRLILDSHALLWFYLGDALLSPAALAAIRDPSRTKLVSSASFWEIAIKVSLRKYALNEPYDDFIQHAIFDNGFLILAIEPRHAAALVNLPHHHKDPFDRLLIAQSMVEGIPIVSVDKKFDSYPISRIW